MSVAMVTLGNSVFYRSTKVISPAMTVLSLLTRPALSCLVFKMEESAGLGRVIMDRMTCTEKRRTVTMVKEDRGPMMSTWLMVRHRLGRDHQKSDWGWGGEGDFFLSRGNVVIFVIIHTMSQLQSLHHLVSNDNQFYSRLHFYSWSI